MGPVLGSWLYSTGGFLLPFCVCGGALLVTGENFRYNQSSLISYHQGVICLHLIKPMTKLAEDQITESVTSQMLPLLQDPNVVIALLSASTAAFAIGYIESLLEMHLEKFSLNVTSIGLCFLAMSCAYTLCTIFIGWIIDTR